MVCLQNSHEDVFLIRLGTSTFQARHEVPNSLQYSLCLSANELIPNMTKNVASVFVDEIDPPKLIWIFGKTLTEMSTLSTAILHFRSFHIRWQKNKGEERNFKSKIINLWSITYIMTSQWWILDFSDCLMFFKRCARVPPILVKYSHWFYPEFAGYIQKLLFSSITTKNNN